MFRGLEASQIRTLMALLAVSFSAVVLLQLQSAPRPSLSASSRGQIDHGPGRLVSSQSPSEPEVVPGDELPTGQIDLNSAGLQELETLPGVGPAKAKAIVAERKARGPYATVEDLARVPGIGAKSIERLRPFLTVGEGSDAEESASTFGAATLESAAPGRIETREAMPDELTTPTPNPTPAPPSVVFVNRAGLEELQLLNGVGEKLAARILLDRRLNGPFRNAKDLQRVKGIGPKTIEKNAGMLRFD